VLEPNATLNEFDRPDRCFGHVLRFSAPLSIKGGDSTGTHQPWQISFGKPPRRSCEHKYRCDQ